MELDDFEKCRTYLGPLPKKGADGAGRKPSNKQTSFALSIAERKGIEVPGAVLADGRKLSSWIDTNR